MLWGSFAEYTRHYPGRVVVIVVGAAVAFMLMAAGVPSVHGAEAAQTGAAANNRDFGPMPIGLPLSASHRLAAALNTAQDGESVAWRDPDSGVTFRVQPLFSFRAGERTCRAFTIRRIAFDSIRESYRTACRRAVGGWTLTTAAAGGNG